MRRKAVAVGNFISLCCCVVFLLQFFVHTAYAGNVIERGGKTVAPKTGQSFVRPTTGATVAQADTRDKAAKVSAPAVSQAGKSKAVTKKTKGGTIKGFSKNPFALENRKPAGAGSAQRTDAAQNATVRTKPARTADSGSEEQDSRIVFSGGGQAKSDDRLIPRRSAFSGGPDTLPRMDEKTPAEMSLTYRMNKKASTSLTVNQQDETSPLYMPGGKDTINGAGVHMNVDVKDDLQLRLGGEFQEVEGRESSQEERSGGASVGLRWTF